MGRGQGPTRQTGKRRRLRPGGDEEPSGWPQAERTVPVGRQGRAGASWNRRISSTSTPMYLVHLDSVVALSHLDSLSADDSDYPQVHHVLHL